MCLCMCVCVWGGGGGRWRRGGGEQAAQGRGQDTSGYLDPRETSCPGGVWVGQDKLLHRLKLDTDKETNHLTELSRNKCTAIDETA